MSDTSVCSKCTHLKLFHCMTLIRATTACTVEGCSCNSYKHFDKRGVPEL